MSYDVTDQWAGRATVPASESVRSTHRRYTSDGRPIVVSPLEVLFGDDADVVRDPPFRLLLVANLSAPLGTALVSPLLAVLTHHYGVSQATVGLLVTVYIAPSIFVIPVVGVLADRVGRTPLLGLGLLLFGVAGTALAFTSDFRVALGLRALQGVGFAALTPVIVTVLGDLYEGAREATAQGIRFSTSGIVLMTLPPLAGVLVTVAWYLPFYIYLLSVPVAGLIWWGLDEPARDESGATDGQTRALLRQLKQPRITGILVSRAVPNFVFVAFLTYNSFVVVGVTHGSPGEAGLLVGASSLVQALSTTQVGRITARFESRAWPLAAATIVMTGGLAVFALARSFLGLLLGSLCIGAGFGVSLSLYRLVITGFSDRFRGGLVSFGSSFGRVAAMSAPLAIGSAVSAARGPLGFGPAVRWSIAVAALGALVVGLGSLGVATAWE